MRLRTRLTLAFAFVTVFAITALLVITEYGIDDLTRQNIETAIDGVEAIAGKNYELSEDILGRYGEKIVEMKARSVANELSLLLAGWSEYDYRKLRKNDRLREIATQDIYSEFPEARQAGYVDVGDEQGHSVWHPNKSVEGRNFAQWREEFPDMWEYVVRSFEEEEVRGYYSFLDRERDLSRKKYMVTRRVRGTPFIVYATVNIDEYFLPVHEAIRKVGRETTAEAEREIETAADRFSVLIKDRSFYLGLFVLLLGGGLGLILASRISRPIRRLRDAVEKLGEGDFSVEVPSGGATETAELSRAFNRLGGRLQEYMENLKQEVSAREAVESEVRIARQIQESLLPHSFPPFPDRREFDLFAVNLAAKEVAGDFYDFFLVDEDRLALVIADVSGKGIPAALFMAVSRTVLKNICVRETDPGRALTEANRAIAQDNEACMFVTLILGFYRISTGEFIFANAGHDDLLLVGGDGEIEPFGTMNGVALGIVEDRVYTSGKKVIAPGQALVFYTDGVTEATSPENKLFGRPRLEKLIGETARLPAREICDRIMEAVTEFQQGKQFDDVTVMVLKRTTRPPG